MINKDKIKDMLLWETTKSLKNALEMSDDELASRYTAKRGAKSDIRAHILAKKALDSPFVLLNGQPTPYTHLNKNEVHLINVAILNHFKERHPALIKRS